MCTESTTQLKHPANGRVSKIVRANQVAHATLTTFGYLVRLLCMFWLGLMQCVGWVTYSASPRIAAEYYGFENPKASIDLLLNWGPIMPLG
jgi:hypothetical protein